MSYFTTDIPFMSDDELVENGLKKPYKKPEIIDSEDGGDNMTNEEAIKLIDDRMCFGRGRWSEHHRPVIDEYWQAGEMAIKALEQPKTGKWISADAMFHGVPFYCSECGENTRDTVMGKPRWKFCPMCGAKMEVTE